MILKEIANQDGTQEYHQVGCSHSKNFVGCFVEEIEVEASNLQQLCSELEAIVNQDFAEEQGMSVEEYLAEGNGYRVNTTPGSEFRVFPCVKF